MAFLQIDDVRIAGICAAVPRRVVSNLDPEEAKYFSADYEPADFVATTGVEQRHISSTLTTSDLCCAAAERLIADLDWDKAEIGALIFVSQTADYVLPATACILQDRLGLSKECYATDTALGCSGWVYGLSQASTLLGHGSITKALLLCGDAKKRYVGGRDPLFGSAGTATAIECSRGGVLSISLRDGRQRLRCHNHTRRGQPLPHNRKLIYFRDGRWTPHAPNADAHEGHGCVCLRDKHRAQVGTQAGRTLRLRLLGGGLLRVPSSQHEDE